MARCALEPGEAGDAVLARVSLVPFPSWLSVGAGQALGSWEPWEPRDELISLRALTVPGVPFPSFLSASAGEARRPREARLPFCSFKAEKETIWSWWSGRPWGSLESWPSISAWSAGVQRGDAGVSYEAFGTHFTWQASLPIFISDRCAGEARGARVSWFTPASWFPMGPWESWVTSGTFSEGVVREVGRGAWGAAVARFSLGSWGSAGALITVRSSAPLLSRETFLAVEAGSTPRA